MASQVEANSLSDLTHLAGNPPKYPRNPTEQKRQPLTFYIARVPGTRDIILTTLKPQLEVITAEDVASSLYYLHLNSADDAKLLGEAQDIIPEETEHGAPPQKPLPRKPLPESARSSLDLDCQTTTVSLGPDPTKRKPVSAATIISAPAQPSSQLRETILRRPLGPRPLHSELSLSHNQLPGSENHLLNSDLQDRATPPSRKINETGKGYTSSDSDAGCTQQERSSSDDFSITLIRRDPSSGAQWNVATMSGHPVMEEGQTKSAFHYKRPYFEILVQIKTLGYMSFKNSHLTSQFQGSTTGRSNSSSEVNFGKQVNSNQDFERQVSMEGSSFWARKSAQHKRKKSDILDKVLTTRERSSSGGNAAAISKNMPLHENSPPDSSDSQSKGYIFLSPWGGRCKFVTSSSGRSLCCKHTLPGPISTSNTTEFSLEASATVSELRFNLPSSAMFTAVASAVSKKTGSDPGRLFTPHLEHIRKKMSSQETRPPLPPRPFPGSYATKLSDVEEPPALPPRPFSKSLPPLPSENESPKRLDNSHPSLYVDNAGGENVEGDRETPLDLSLGQERAGGGIHGKRAKLGKLIIHDEGFKMLDLIVAANMSIWWSVWESDRA